MSKRKSPDYFKLLGVTPEAGEDDIRAAFRKLARRYHPDAGKSADSERFRRIRKAYEVLSDARRRAQYLNQLGEGSIKVRFGVEHEGHPAASTVSSQSPRPNRRPGPPPRQQPRSHVDLSRPAAPRPFDDREDDLLYLISRLMRGPFGW